MVDIMTVLDMISSRQPWRSYLAPGSLRHDVDSHTGARKTLMLQYEFRVNRVFKTPRNEHSCGGL